MSQTLLEVTALDKTFAVPVLKNLNFSLRAGEVHALMGSNGAGKSTLCNIIAGVHQPTAGALSFSGQTHAPANTQAAESVGIRMVMQELTLFPTLTVAENVCFKALGNQLGIIDKKALNERTKKALSLVGLESLDPTTPLETLGVGQQQLIEIASVIQDPLKLLILDEPTAALTDPQIDILFDRIHELKQQGVGIIYISHRMDEIQRISDRISILRDGQLVATEEAAALDQDRIVQLMAGEALVNDTSTNQSASHASPVLKVEGFSREPYFRGIDLEIRQGEILGIGGLIGSGRSELLNAIFGADVADEGTLAFAINDWQKQPPFTKPRQAIDTGIGMIVEDRKSQGLLLEQPIDSNISLAKLNQFASQSGVIRQSQEATKAHELCDALAVKYDNLNQHAGNLSGGNQQKVLIARWLLLDTPILFFDEPSRGVDARAKQLIHQLIRRLAAEGKAIVVISSETQELLSLSQRIAVMSNGRLSAEFTMDEVTEEKLLEASFRFYSSQNDSETDDALEETQ